MSFASFLAEKIDRPELSELSGMPFSRIIAKLKDDGTYPPSAFDKYPAEYFSLKLASKPKGEIDSDLLKPLSVFATRSGQFLPLKKRTNGSIQVAISSPDKALDLVDDYARIMQVPLDITFMPEAELTKLINQTWDAKSKNASDVMSDVDEEDSLEAELHQTEDLLDADDEAPVIRLINSILAQAMKESASDIHIEPFEKHVNVRFRVDGVMHTVITPSRKLQAAMSARLKVMAGLDIAEKRLPQDGRFKIKLAGRETDIRISTLPTQHGERIVLRLLGQQEGIRAIDQIGMRPEQVEKLRECFDLANGMIFICGPTGSGKTSTLYAGLKEINKPDKNIVTVEDPVEYELEGLGQIPVNAKIGMTFAAGLRSILRQDPDVVVVGETRDLETAEIAIEASLTGHLVISTIHTNDSAATVTRLVEMGIEPFLVASSMRCVIAQRMVRRLHPTIRKEVEMDDETRAIFDELPEWARPKDIKLYEPEPSPGCPTGYQGRMGIFEMLLINEPIRQKIHAKGSDADIRETAQENGMLTLYQEGLLRAARGETSLEEVLRVTRTQG